MKREKNGQTVRAEERGGQQSFNALTLTSTSSEMTVIIEVRRVLKS